MCVSVSDINFDVVSGFGPLFLHILLNLYLLFLKILSFLLRFLLQISLPLASSLRPLCVYLASTLAPRKFALEDAWPKPGAP